MIQFRTQQYVSNQYYTLIQGQNANTNPSQIGSDFYIRGQVLGNIISGAQQDLYLAGLATYVQTSVGEDLDLLAASYSIQGRAAGYFAVGSARLPSNAPSTFTIPAGTPVSYSGNNIDYIVDADTQILIGTQGVIPIRSTSLGTGQQIPNGTVVTLGTPINTFNTLVIIQMTDGQGLETDAQMQARILFLLQNPPLGGTIGDYQAWALSQSGVTDALILPNFTSQGIVGIFLLSGGADYDVILENPGVPYNRTANSTVISQVTNYINSVRPANDSIFVTTVDTYQVPLIVSVTVVLANDLTLSSLIPGTSLTAEQIIQREVRRAIIESPTGGTIIGGNRYLLLSSIEQALDIGLSASLAETGIYASILVDRMVQYNDLDQNIMVPSSLNEDENGPFIYDIVYSNIVVTEA